MSAWAHALGWMLVANAVGVLLAVLLLFPQLGLIMGEWTYGRIVPLHLNLHLYGWLSLPLIGALFHVYRVHEAAAGVLARPVVWLWSVALAVGSWSWLSGVSSGKVFLDWKGVPCHLFAAVMSGLWILLAVVWWQGRDVQGSLRRLFGLLGLLPVPVALFLATRPELYPPVNPDTGGPTGASLLGSTLSVVFLLLILPMICGCRREGGGKRLSRSCWAAFVLELLLFLMLGQGESSHREVPQILGLGSLMVWIPLMTLYHRLWIWRDGMRKWGSAMLFWLGLLILTGWLSFLPGWLDRLKFTNGLVAHSHLAMAGFCSCFLMLLMGQVSPGPVGRVLGRTREFVCWQCAVVGYVALMWFCGWKESNDPGFVIMRSEGAVVLYVLRAVCGVVMLWVSFRWWRDLLEKEDYD